MYNMLVRVCLVIVALFICTYCFGVVYNSNNEEIPCVEGLHTMFDTFESSDYLQTDIALIEEMTLKEYLFYMQDLREEIERLNDILDRQREILEYFQGK